MLLHAQVVVRESERRSQAAMREWEHASLTDLVLLPLLPYLVWACIYYGKARAGQGLLAPHSLACSKSLVPDSRSRSSLRAAAHAANIRYYYNPNNR